MILVYRPSAAFLVYNFPIEHPKTLYKLYLLYGNTIYAHYCDSRGYYTYASINAVIPDKDLLRRCYEVYTEYKAIRCSQ